MRVKAILLTCPKCQDRPSSTNLGTFQMGRLVKISAYVISSRGAYQILACPKSSHHEIDCTVVSQALLTDIDGTWAALHARQRRN